MWLDTHGARQEEYLKDGHITLPNICNWVRCILKLLTLIAEYKVRPYIFLYSARISKRSISDLDAKILFRVNSSVPTPYEQEKGKRVIQIYNLPLDFQTTKGNVQHFIKPRKATVLKSKQMCRVDVTLFMGMLWTPSATCYWSARMFPFCLFPCL